MKRTTIERFRTDQRAVSPVLGVALLIAITVILAGVIGFVVLGVQAGNADGPSVSLEFQQNGTTVTMVHKGGDPVEASNVEFRGAATGSPSTDLTAGTEVTVGTFSSDDVIRVVWMDPSSDREVLLAEYTVE